MNRGIRRSIIFHDDLDRRKFLRLLRDSTNRYGVEVVAYCLMGNHFHLLLAEDDKLLLSRSLQLLCSRYAKYFNRKYGHDGPLFRSRFLSKPIRDDRQLLVTSRYIHRNPVGLGLDIDTYRWSSYRHYIGKVSIDWIAPDIVVDQFYDSAHYQAFVETPVPSDKQTEAHASDPDLSVAALWEDIALLELSFLRWDVRSAVALVAHEADLASIVEIQKVLGFESAPSVRVALCRARRKTRTVRSFADLVERVRQYAATLRSLPENARGDVDPASPSMGPRRARSGDRPDRRSNPPARNHPRGRDPADRSEMPMASGWNGHVARGEIP